MSTKHRTLLAVACTAILTLVNYSAQADAKDQAKRIYDRIAGVPATDAVLNTMAGMDLTQAALQYATKDPNFYNSTIRNLAAPWTNRDQSVFVPLNDYTATVVGMVRDDLPFTGILSADILYTADGASGAPAYSTSNNAMYQYMDDHQVDLSVHLSRQLQSATTNLPATATAGVLTTRAAAQAFFINGTNRAMFRFTMMNHLCSDLQTIPDTTRPPDRIRQDVTRSPGGDSSLFLNNCIECHSGMDPMAQAFAFYDFAHDINADPTGVNGQISYTPGQVQQKYTINATNFPQGFITPDDRWDNRWRAGANAKILAFDPTLPGTGNGAQTLGQELAASQAFASCQVTRVFKYVCFRAPTTAGDQTQILTMMTNFKSSSYSLRRAFADAAVYCTTPGN